MPKQNKSPSQTLINLLDQTSKINPSATALLHNKERISYGTLQKRVYNLASQLEKLGIKKEDRIGIWLPNIPEWIEVFFASAHLGAIAVSINTRFGTTEVADILNRSGCKALFIFSTPGDDKYLSKLSQLDEHFLTALETVITIGKPSGEGKDLENIQLIPYAKLTQSSSPLSLSTTITPSSKCIMFTTSGTTSLPKLVVHNQNGIASHARDIAKTLKLDIPSSVILQAIPFCGVFGFSQAMAAISSGASILCLPSFDATSTIDLIKEHNVTHLNGSDEMFDRLLHESTSKTDFTSVAFCGYANFTPSLTDIVHASEEFGLALVGLYGTSELLAFLAIQRPELPASQRRRMGGFPVGESTKVRVRDPETGETLPKGEVGELEFKCVSQMEGYYQNPNATARAVTKDGFFKSGDLGKICDDGSFEFLSRMGDVLRLGGFLVNPEEIESFIQKHPKVIGCQVVGINGPKRPTCAAFITTEKGTYVSTQEIREFCQTSLAKYKVPAYVFLISKFPTTTGPNGTKIQRTVLRDLAQEKIVSTSSST